MDADENRRHQRGSDGERKIRRRRAESAADAACADSGLGRPRHTPLDSGPVFPTPVGLVRAPCRVGPPAHAPELSRSSTSIRGGRSPVADPKSGVEVVRQKTCAG